MKILCSYNEGKNKEKWRRVEKYDYNRVFSIQVGGGGQRSAGFCCPQEFVKAIK